MTYKELILHHPIQEGESFYAYARRISEISGGRFSVETCRRTHARLRQTRMKTTKANYDRNGNLVSFTQKPVQKEFLNVDLPVHRVSTNVTTGQQWIIQQANGKTDKFSFFDSISKLIKEYKPERRKIKRSKTFHPVRLSNIATDIHAGMCIEGDMYGYEWDKDILTECFDINNEELLDFASGYGKVAELYLYDLGDALDGYEGSTTRGGHGLPQNMTTAEQFELIFSLKMAQIDLVMEHDIADKVVVWVVSNDNHSGPFSQSLYAVLRKMCHRIYGDRVEFVIQHKFLDHRIFGDTCIITTHGKDMVFMKQGMPYSLNHKWESVIGGYIRQNKLADYRVELWKGDMHRQGLSTHPLFKYRNFKAFSPPSGWVQSQLPIVDDIGFTLFAHWEDSKMEMREVAFDFPKILKNVRDRQNN